MLIKNARIYRNQTRSFMLGDLWIENGRIRSVGSTDGYKGEIYDAEGVWIVPGLLDVHTHGRAGYDFLACSEEAYSVMAADYARYGVTTVMPTLATATLEEMLMATKMLTSYAPKENESNFIGTHWEGRYINPAKKGAHAPKLLAPLCAEELKSEELRNCRPLHISASYELDRDGSFAEAALKLGATLGLAHTEATYKQAKELESKGLTSYTHLYNTMPTLHHRDGGAICAAFEGDCYAELICDGIHISPEMVRLAYRMKGCDRLSLISDSIEAAGCSDGEYNIAGVPATVKNGIARTPEGNLAGSTLSLDQAVNNLIDFCGIPLTDAIVSATEAPARQVRVFDRYGSIDEGKSADLLFLKNGDRLDIERVMLRGVWLNQE